MSFPVFSLRDFEHADSARRRSLAATVDAICRETGFLAIRDHGVDQEVIDRAWNAAHDFFDQPFEAKQGVKAPYPGYPYGYLGPDSEALAKSRNVDTPPDLKESFNGGPLKIPEGLDDAEALAFCYAPTIWPDEPAGFRQAWEDYYRAMEDLAARIMRLFGLALDLPEDTFDDAIDQPVSALRALNYPAQDRPPKPGQLRAGAHSDYGSLTILLPQKGSGGLEIFSPEGDWRPVPPVDGAFVINIGDLMARWTNDRWVSTLHRVVNPDAGQRGTARRQSFAFFHQPNWEKEIVCLPSCLRPGEAPRYEPVRSGPYLMGKFKATAS
ncbi:MAG: isopenicillin N synthase family oxygenase [Brucellaceae bacterium]|nr:isopenicillin N synthase family oxygenase [Brucellaceae bacterium]